MADLLWRIILTLGLATLLHNGSAVASPPGGPPEEPAIQDYNQTAQSGRVYLFHRVESEGVLMKLKLFIRDPANFSVTIWTPVKGPEDDHGRRRRSRGQQDEMMFTMKAKIPVRDMTVMRQRTLQWIYVKKDPNQCPYVYEDDHVGLYSADGTLPIPLMINGGGQVYIYDTGMSHSREAMFKRKPLQFAIFKVDIKRAPPPRSRSAFVDCDGNKDHSPPTDGIIDGGPITIPTTTQAPTPPSTTEAKASPTMRASTTSASTLSASTVSASTLRASTVFAPVQASFSLDTISELYIILSVVSAVAFTATLTSVYQCIRSCRNEKVTKRQLSAQSSLVPLYTGSFTRHIENQPGLKPSVRNPMYHENTDFLRSVSLDTNNQFPYVLVPSMMLPPGEYAHYEEVKSLASRQASLRVDGGNAKKARTYLDLRDDESVVDETSPDKPVPTISGNGHKGISRQESGAYSKIED